jgi:two-component system sensor histidine kinase YesM
MKLSDIIFRGRLRNKIFFYFVFTVCLCASTVGIVSYKVSEDVLKDKVTGASLMTINNMADTMQRELNQIKEFMDYLFIDNAIQDALQKDVSTDYAYITQNTLLFESLKKYEMLDLFNYINIICIYTYESDPQTFLYHSYRSDIFHQRVIEKNWLQEAENKDGRIFWAGFNELESYRLDSEPTMDLSVLRSIKGNKYRDKLGVAYASIKPDFLTVLQSKNKNFQNGRLIIFDQNGKVINEGSSSGQKEDYEYRMKLHNTKQIQQGCKVYSDSKNLMFLRTIPEYNYELMAVLSIKELMHDSNQIVIVVLVVVFFTALISSLLWLYLTRRLTKPVQELAERMFQVRKGDFTVRASINGNDEISMLSRDFNYMLEQINILFDEVRQKERRISDAEYKAVLAQVNPHFIYNVLNSIRLMAIINKADNIRDMVSVLWRILKRSTTKVGNEFTLGDELHNVSDYSYIEQMVNQNKFELEFDVDETLLKCRFPKFIIQPLVENAIVHGIRPKEGFSVITVSVKRQGDEIEVIVTNDGIAIEKQLLEEIQASLSSNSSSLTGIGLSSIQRRIQEMFGENYGLNIEGGENQKTTISFRLPIIED